MQFLSRLSCFCRFKACKDRITVVVTTNATGDHVVKPLLIGKAENPRAFRGRNREEFVFWRSNAKAWMNSLLMAEWIKDMFVPMVRQYLCQLRIPRSKWKVVLIVDNCPGHGSVEYMQKWCPDWLTIRNLPPNTTSIIQPNDGGIIMKFKRRYRRHLLRLMTVLDSRTVDEFKKQFNMWHVLGLVVAAMNDLTPEETSMVWDRTIYGGPCHIQHETTEEEEEADRLRRREEEPGYWVREAREEEQAVEREIDQLTARLSAVGLDSSQVKAWLDIDEAIQRPDNEPIELDDALEAVIGGLGDVELATRGEGSDDEIPYDSGDESCAEAKKSGGPVPYKEIQDYLLKCAVFFDRKGSNPSFGQMCRDLAFEAHSIGVSSRVQTSIEDYFGL